MSDNGLSCPKRVWAVLYREGPNSRSELRGVFRRRTDAHDLSDRLVSREECFSVQVKGCRLL